MIFAAHAGASDAAPVGADQPKVLIRHVDQLRFDCLGAYGNPDVKTPRECEQPPYCAAKGL